MLHFSVLWTLKYRWKSSWTTNYLRAPSVLIKSSLICLSFDQIIKSWSMKNTGTITIPGCAVVRPPLSVLRRHQQPLSTACTGQICQHATHKIKGISVQKLCYVHLCTNIGNMVLGALSVVVLGDLWLLEALQELANNVLKWFLFFPTTWIKKECWVAQRSPVEACPCVYQKQSKWDNFLVQKELWLKSLFSINVQPDPTLALELSEHKPNHLGSEAQKLHNLVVMMITIMMMGSVKMEWCLIFNLGCGFRDAGTSFSQNSVAEMDELNTDTLSPMAN